MTDTTTEAPERITYNPGYRVTYHGSDPSRGYVYVRDDLHTAAAAAHDEDRARLAVAICGGEDLPGYANSASTEELVRIACRSHSDHMETIDRLLKAQAKRGALAAQLAAAEARARSSALDALAKVDAIRAADPVTKPD